MVRRAESGKRLMLAVMGDMKAVGMKICGMDAGISPGLTVVKTCENIDLMF